MDLLLSNLEKYAVPILLMGLVLALIAFLWLVVAAFRGARTRGPLLLFFLGGLAAGLPALAHALDGRVADLSGFTSVLDGGVRLQLATVDGRVGPIVAIKAKALLFLLSAVLSGVALLWLILASFGQWSRVRRPVQLFVLASFLIALPFAANRLAQAFVDLGPRERVVNGESHLTLTGWDRSDYATVLAARPNTTVLQMANDDVTDETLRSLESTPHLKKLDLSDTKVTDGGLAALRPLTALESLHLARTGITDMGFSEHLAQMESLKQLDLKGTQVSPDVVRAWQNAKQGRRAIVR